MPKFLVTNGSNFQPFTYEEITRPLYEMAEAHRASQDQYDAISTQTEALRNYITDNPGDKQAKQMYDNYVNKLKTLQDNLWSTGYNASTRRDLQSARAGFASDINRIGKAIENRQARSAEYWKAKHDHPDMIMGTDPGESGLDNYIADDNYGQNYYSYSGTQFMSEVGADAKARADEMLNDPQIMRDPNLAGYLQAIKRNGFSSNDVMAASQAVRSYLNGDNTGLNNLDPASAILADVLINHLNSTGAAGNVSASEFSRLFDYGVSGLSQAIGKTDIQYMSDKVWDFNKQIALENYRNRMRASATSTPTGLTGQSQNVRPSYSLEELSTFMKNRSTNSTLSDISKYYLKPFEKPVVLRNGTVISNPQDAENILNGLGRGEIMDRFIGLDPSGKSTGTAIVRSGGVDKNIRVWQGDNGDMIVKSQNEKGKWDIDKSLTDEYNKMYSSYQKKLNEWKKANPDVNIEKLIISSKDIDKLKKRNNISGDISAEEMPYVLAARSNAEMRTPAVIANTDKAMDSTRENYARRIIESYNRAVSQQGKIGKTDERAFYPVNNGVVSNKGVGIDEVFGKNKDGKREGVLTSVNAYPEDIIRNRVRITVNDKEYLVNPAMLGNNMDAQVGKLINPVSSIMTPLTNPEVAMRMSDEDAVRWAYEAQSYLGSFLPLIGTDRYGNITYVITPKDIIKNPPLQGELRTAVNHLMEGVLSDARDEMMLRNYQVRGNTSANAEGYNDYLEQINY